MFKFKGKSLIFAIAISLLMTFRVYASSSEVFPFKVSFDLDYVDRLCYAGHEDSVVRYEDGFAITPDASFYISKNDAYFGPVDVADLSCEVSFLYGKGDNPGLSKELIRRFEKGSLSTETYYELLTPNNIANLFERGRLYSDPLSGMVITFSFGSEDSPGNDLIKDIYLYVCDFDDYTYYYENANED